MILVLITETLLANMAGAQGGWRAYWVLLAALAILVFVAEDLDSETTLPRKVANVKLKV